MGNDQLYTLLKKYRKGNCTPEEEEELNHWYGEFNGDMAPVSHIPQEKLDALFGQVRSRISQRERKATVIRRVWGYASGVAAAVIVLIGVFYFYSSPGEPGVPGQYVRENGIKPGRIQAELVLSDGSRVALDTVNTIREKDGRVIKSDSSRLLDYTLSALQKGNSCEYNTISVPKGGEYHFTLADGSRVWLNSGSTLRYPVAFYGSKREVILHGEGFFKVAKSTTPFVVKTFDLDVQVLGTSFNVSAYGDEDRVVTTLVEGRVEVCNNHSGEKFLMEPGYMLEYEKSDKMTSLEECDTEIYTSWVEGEFKFRDMRLEDIMKRVNRWYTCGVKYENNSLRELRFSGAAEKDKPAVFLLELIESVTDVRFEISGNTIIVKDR